MGKIQWLHHVDVSRRTAPNTQHAHKHNTTDYAEYSPKPQYRITQRLRLRRITPDNIIHNVIRRDGTQDTQTCPTHMYNLFPRCNAIESIVWCTQVVLSANCFPHIRAYSKPFCLFLIVDVRHMGDVRHVGENDRNFTLSFRRLRVRCLFGCQCVVGVVLYFIICIATVLPST